MNCREAEPLIFAARDGALDEVRRAALAEHLGQCAACRATQSELEAAANSWRTAAASARTPAVEVEWRAIRRRLHDEQPDSVIATSRGMRALMWSLATAAAAVVALAAFVGPRWLRSRSTDVPQEPGYVSYVVVENTSAATMIYEDEQSGWLVVWVSDEAASAGT